MATEVEQLYVSLGLNMADFKAGISKSNQELDTFASKAESTGKKLTTTGKAITDVGNSLLKNITLPVAAAGAASFKFASDYDENLNKVRVAFKNTSGNVEQFAKTTLDNFGIAENSALEMAALFGDMATGMQLPVTKASEMSQSLVGLAGDLSSFKNVAINEVQTALSGIFTGETESLKRLGIVMTEANLQAYALSQGINKTVSEMTQAEKVQLRYAYVMDVTKNAQGDFARTSDGAANQLRILGQSAIELAVSFGQELLPIFTPLITKAVDIVKQFGELDSKTKQTIITIAGIGAGVGPAIVGIGNLVTAAGNITTALGKVSPVVSNVVPAIASVGTSIAGLLGPVGLLVAAVGTAAVVGWNLYKNAQEEARKSMIEAGDELRKLSDKAETSLRNLGNTENLINNYKSLKEAIESNSLSAEALAEAKQQLNEIEQQLITASDGLITKYDLQNGKLDEQIPLLMDKLSVERDIAIIEAQEKVNSVDLDTLKAEVELLAKKKDTLTDTFESQSKALKEIEILEKQYLAIMRDTTLSEEERSRKVMELRDRFKELGDQFGINTELLQHLEGATEIARETVARTSAELLKVTNEYKQGKISLEELIRAIELLAQKDAPEVFADQTKAVKETTKAVKDTSISVDELTERFTKLYKEVDTTIQSAKDLRDAYDVLHAGGKISIDQLLEMIELYPEVADYIAATGDVSLKNGEILKAVAQTRLDTIREELKAEEGKLAAEIQLAKARIGVTEQEYQTKARIAEGYYASFIQASDPMNESLKKEMAIYKELESNLKRVQGQISALSNVTFENINVTDNLTRSTKSSASALKEEEKAAKEAAKALEEKQKATVQSIDNLNSAVVSALENRYAKEKQIELDWYTGQIDNLKGYIDTRKAEYDRDYDNRVKSLQAAEKAELESLKGYIAALDAEAAAQISGIQAQIDAIDNQTKAEDKAAKEQAYQKELAEKYKRLAVTENAEEAAKITEEINEYIARRERELLLERRSQEKDSLREQISQIRENLSQQKEVENQKMAMLKDNYASQREMAKAEYDNNKSLAEQQLREETERLQKEKKKREEHYAELMNKEVLNAESRKLLLDGNSKELVDLLESYNPKWRDAGQSLGDSLVNGLNSKKSDMQTAVNEILSMIEQVNQAQSGAASTASKNVQSQNNTYSDYVVRAGDTLSALAKQFNTTVQSIASLNAIKDVNRIYTGQSLQIPKFHDGGIFRQREGLALLQQGEMILTQRQQSNLLSLLEQGSNSRSGGSRVVNIYADGMYKGDLVIRDERDLRRLSNMTADAIGEILSDNDRTGGAAYALS